MTNICRLPLVKGLITLMFWVMLMPETLLGQRRDGELEITGRIEQSYEPVGNGTIRIFEGSRLVKSETTNSRGRFSFTLPLEGEYMAAFSAPGLVTKRLLFDTRIQNRRTRERFFQFDFVVDLFPEIDGIDFTFFEEPLSTIAFIDEINRFFFRESETSPRLRRANEIHRQVVDLIRRREAYAQTIIKADQFFRNQRYDQARVSYVEANGFLPDENHPVRRIEEIDRILANQREQRAQDLARQQEIQREREREQQAEQERQRLQREQQAAANRQQEAERQRQAELAQQQEAERQRQAEQERLRLERERQAELTRQQEAERQRQAELAQQQEAERQRQAEQERLRLERERQAELTRQQEAERQRQAELAQQQEAERQRQAELAQQQEAERQRQAEQERLRLERERQAELTRQQEAERQRQAALAQQQSQQRQQASQPAVPSADNQREYNAAIAQGDQLLQRRQLFAARDAYQLALSFRPNEIHPTNRIREINQILADSEEMARFYANGFFDVSNVKERILNNSEKRYYFVPFDRRRTGSYLMLQAENLDGKPMRLFINYGKDNERLGGFSINIGGQSGVTDLRIDISGQTRWINEDNNWISIYPLGGNIELHNLKIHFGPGQ